MFVSKIKATIVHLAISLIVVGIVIGLILWLFFPSIYVNVTDFKEVAGIIIMVDLILGPLLTFVVFQPKKKSLKLR